MPAPFTQLGPGAVPMRRYGDFSGRAPPAEEIVAAAPEVRRGGRFIELPSFAIYTAPILVLLPSHWRIAVLDHEAARALPVRERLSRTWGIGIRTSVAQHAVSLPAVLALPGCRVSEFRESLEPMSILAPAPTLAPPAVTVAWGALHRALVDTYMRHIID